jgi:Concanavalin A-like lectin/glucanases superfamily
VTANGASVRVILSNGALGDQTWHHVAATFNNGTVKLYVNGALDRTVSGVLTPLISTEPVAFGREGTYPGGTFNGLIDEVRIWNVVRSGSQIARSITRRLQGSETGLVGYWRLDEGSGQVAADATGHGLNGRLGETAGADVWDPTWTTPAAPVY